MDIAKPNPPRRIRPKRDRRKENFAKTMRGLMRRLAVINDKYGADIYFCAKYTRWFEFSTNASLPPSADQIHNAYPLAVRSSPGDLRRENRGGKEKMEDLMGSEQSGTETQS